MRKKYRTTTFGLIIMSMLLAGCSSIYTQSKSEITKGLIMTAITGNPTSYGHEANCFSYQSTCKDYREWRQDGKIACSCGD